MIDAASFVEAFEFLARMRGTPMPDGATLRDIHAEAASCARSSPEDEPAALFYALARRPKALRGLWRTATVLFARNAARVGGRTLEVSDGALTRLRLDVAQGAAFEDVRAHFATWLR